MTLRLLTASDQAAVEKFLARDAAATMFLRSNIAASGLVPGDQPFHGLYAGRFETDTLTDVVAHYWNQNIIMYAPSAAVEVTAFLVEKSQRDVKGLLGPWGQCVAVLDRLSLRARAREPHCEDLFELQLDALNASSLSGVECRRATTADVKVLTQFRADYEVETLAAPQGPGLKAGAQENIQRLIALDHLWVATVDDEPVAMSAINARLPEMVQVGGVYTPKEFRGRGYANVVVGGSLRDCRNEGAQTAILFTEVRNTSAKRVYASLGFKRVGDYGLILID